MSHLKGPPRLVVSPNAGQEVINGPVDDRSIVCQLVLVKQGHEGIAAPEPMVPPASRAEDKPEESQHTQDEGHRQDLNGSPREGRMSKGAAASIFPRGMHVRQNARPVLKHVH